MNKPRLQPHQQATLRQAIAELPQGLSADDAFAAITSPDVARRLARTRYAEQGNKPGYPNVTRRADFDLIWQETR